MIRTLSPVRHPKGGTKMMIDAENPTYRGACFILAHAIAT